VKEFCHVQNECELGWFETNRGGLHEKDWKNIRCHHASVMSAFDRADEVRFCISR
jgi:hypothetical protein